MAIELGAGFVPVRKPGKLPFDRHSFRYDLEYGSDTLEMHVDGVPPGARVLVVDDLARDRRHGGCVRQAAGKNRGQHRRLRLRHRADCRWAAGKPLHRIRCIA